MSVPWIESGPPSSRVWLVGEAPGREEIAQGRPLCGPSGFELDRMLREAGWTGLDGLFRTNICHSRPPSYLKRGKWVHNDIDQFFAGTRTATAAGLPLIHGRFPREPILQGLARLRQLASRHHPQLIIALGSTALWGLCGHDGITKWRGSVLPALPDTPFGAGPTPTKVVPTLHPSLIVDPQKGMWTYRSILVQDLRRALAESRFPDLRQPDWDFTIAPTLPQVRDWLIAAQEEGQPVVSDTEGWGVVDCIGFATSSRRAICIPFTRTDPDPAHVNYWSLDDECQVFALVRQTLERLPITFHNAIWDMQVICRWWGYYPRLTDDTMVAQHVAFPGLLGGKIDPVTGQTDKKGSSLSLSFISSMYCDIYRYWKDDGRVRNPNASDDDEWRYNCEDCARTHECRSVLVDNVLPGAGLTSQYQFVMSVFRPVLKMMFRGLPLNLNNARAVRATIQTARSQQQEWLNTVLGYPLNVHSTHAGGQIQTLLYEDLALPPNRSRKTGALSTNDETLEGLCRKNPLLTPLLRHIQNIRSLDTNEANFIRPVLGGWYPGPGGKPRYYQPAGDTLHTCLNPTGTETFRFSSNETAFGEGMNSQNFTRPSED